MTALSLKKFQQNKENPNRLMGLLGYDLICNKNFVVHPLDEVVFLEENICPSTEEMLVNWVGTFERNLTSRMQSSTRAYVMVFHKRTSKYILLDSSLCLTDP